MEKFTLRMNTDITNRLVYCLVPVAKLNQQYHITSSKQNKYILDFALLKDRLKNM